jgi:hypothetical protein
MKGGQVTGCVAQKAVLRSIMERLENGTAGKGANQPFQRGSRAFIPDEKRTNP